MKEKNSHNNAKRYGMVIDLDKCTGCGFLHGCLLFGKTMVPFKADENQ